MNRSFPLSTRSFEDRVALVTGAASGIGAATAHLLARLGATVVGTDVQGAAGWQEAWPRSAPRTSFPGLALDVRREEAWEATMEAIQKVHGHPDLLVHAAGVSAASPIEATPLADWRRVMETNLDGTFLAIKHGVRVMEASGGSILVIGSAAGLRPTAGAAAYSTSKAAVAHLARAAAKECRERGLPVRINVVSPAGVKTPMWSSMGFFRDLVAEHGSEDAAFAAMERRGGGRFQEPDRVAEAIAFLLSDAADHITGVELPLDDGYTL
jgi:2-keto-3-deoxy-L-fuconate dehydrogenase